MRPVEIIDVESPLQALRLARMRNASRKFFTHDQGWIGPFRQLRWYFSSYRKSKEIFGYLMQEDGRDVGYGLLRKDGERWVVTGGLARGSRGHGLGALLFQHLICEGWRRGADEIWLDVFLWNARACKLYRKLGFETVGDDGKVAVMKKTLMGKTT